MTTTSTGAVPSGAASGRSRAKKATTNGKGPHVQFKDLDLVLPPADDAPGDLAFSVENNEVSTAVKSILGDEQYIQVRQKCAAEKLNMTDTYTALAELLKDCFVAWEFIPGE